jgi:hypothetical protein
MPVAPSQNPDRSVGGVTTPPCAVIVNTRYEYGRTYLVLSLEQLERLGRLGQQSSLWESGVDVFQKIDERGTSGRSMRVLDDWSPEVEPKLFSASASISLICGVYRQKKLDDD